MKFTKVLALAFALIMIASCGDDDNLSSSETPISPLENYNPASELVQASLIGTVIDESEIPVAAAIVMHRGEQYETDDNGIFVISNKTFDNHGAYFTVQKDGYFTGSRRFYPQAGSTNYAYVQLMELTTIGRFDAGTGGEVVGADNIELSFSGNSILSADGTTYTGQVAVSAKWLDPTAPNVGLLMPGDLLGLDNEGSERGLISYGMMVVELFSSNGEKLNLNPNRPATISFPIPSELVGIAPETIPLWSFEDEQYGIWVEEGFARLEGEKYIGEVSHFSFWNCDAPFDIIEICGQLVTNSRVPIANTLICFESPEIEQRCGTTDSNGFFNGKVPEAVLLSLSIKSELELCGFETISVGPFSDSDKVDLGVIDLDVLQIEEFTVSGTVVDCDDKPLTNGYIRIDLDTSTNTYLLEPDGSFNVGILNCNLLDVFSITATDITGLESGDKIEKNISSEVDCGVVQACGTEVCITDNLFIGNYMLTLADTTGLGYGLPYVEQLVTIETVAGNVPTDNIRSFSSLIFPDIGSFGPYETTFQLECDNARYLLMDTNGLGCGNGGIMYGPSYDTDGEQVTAPLDINDDSEIILYFNPGYADGGCPALDGDVQVKMILTKQ